MYLKAKEPQINSTQVIESVANAPKNQIANNWHRLRYT